jgi:hypothetical protein
MINNVLFWNILNFFSIEKQNDIKANKEIELIDIVNSLKRASKDLYSNKTSEEFLKDLGQLQE